MSDSSDNKLSNLSRRLRLASSDEEDYRHLAPTDEGAKKLSWRSSKSKTDRRGAKYENFSPKTRDNNLISKQAVDADDGRFEGHMTQIQRFINNRPKERNCDKNEKENWSNLKELRQSGGAEKAVRNGGFGGDRFRKKWGEGVGDMGEDISERKWPHDLFDVFRIIMTIFKESLRWF